MKKKLVILLLLSALSINVISCGGSESDSNSKQTEVIKEDSAETPADAEGKEDDTQPEDGTAENEDDTLEALGDVDVEKELFDVTITLPSQYVGETTQEELNEQAAQFGYKVTKNDDGSATYVMTKSQHKEMLNNLANEFHSALSDIAGSEDYPNITEITANENFTDFKVTTKSAEPDMSESFLSIAFYMYGGMYNIFSGEDVDNIHIDFINADTGEIISSSDSSDTGSQ